MYSRRRVLQASAGVLSVGLAGCPALEQPDPEGRIAWIDLTNDSDESHEVRVTVAEDQATKLFETYQLGTTPDTANALIESPVSGTGQYYVQATMTNQSASIATPQLIKDNERCIGVAFLITTDGTLLWEAKSMQQC